MARLPTAADMGQRPAPYAPGPAQVQTGAETVPGSALATFGATVSHLGQLIEVQQKHNDTVAAEDAFNKLREKQLDLSLGQDGFQHKQGKDAEHGIITDYEKKFDDATAQISKSLGNDEQRQMFAQRAHIARQQYRNDLLSHVTQQQQAYARQVYKSGLTVEREQGASRWQDPAGVALSITRSGALIDQQAQREGWAPDAIKAAKAAQTSAIHTEVIAQAVAAENTAYAKQWYADHKQAIDPADRPQIEHLLHTSSVRADSQQQADRIVATGKPAADMLASARKIKDPDVRDATVKRIQARVDEQQALTRQDQQQAASDAWKAVVESGSRDAIPDATWARLDGQDQRQIVDYLSAKATKAAKGRSSDDYKVLDAAQRGIEQGDITDPAQLEPFVPFLKDGTVHTLRKLIDKRGHVSPTVIRRAFEDRLGKTRAHWGDGDREQFLAFQDYITQNVQKTHRPEDIGSWSDQWFMSGYGAKDSFWHSDPSTFGAARMAGRTDFLIETPSDAQPKVAAALSLMQSAGAKIPQGKSATDEFYTRYQLSAERWFGDHGIAATPDAVAAFALLKGNGKPITIANLQHVAAQLKAGGQ